MGQMIHDLHVSVYRIATDEVESDGTLEWNHTIMIIVEVASAGQTGIGYTYGDACIAAYIQNTLRTVITGRDPFDIPKMVRLMSEAIRNDGQEGVSRMACSAVDIALWDLKARLLHIPVAQLIGKARDELQIYGSGGFISYSDKRLEAQLGQWAADGFAHVKMKIGCDEKTAWRRVRIARGAIGKNVALFVDANGACTAKQALAFAEKLSTEGVSWFEEPVSSDDLPGLRFVREQCPASINVAAGEYGYGRGYFLRMLQAEAVDVLQADATRCGGISGFLKAGELSDIFHVPFSFHCAPAAHLQAALCVPSFFIGEYFHDHVRIEQMFFDGIPTPVNGKLSPYADRPGLGLELKRKDMVKYRIG